MKINQLKYTEEQIKLFGEYYKTRILFKRNF